MKPALTLILGGIRSGKSERAEVLVRSSGLVPVYIATARPLDKEMRARIARHRERRGEGWRTVEAPLDLAGAIEREADPARILLVDGLGVWLTNLLVERQPVEPAIRDVEQALAQAPGPAVVVSEEVGLAPIPADPLTRRLADLLGGLNRRLAARASRVELVVAGLPLTLKPPGNCFD